MIGGLGETRDSDIGLDPGIRVQELGVDDPTRGHGDVIAADPVEESLGIRALNPDLPEGGHVVDPHTLADRHVLGCVVTKPVLPLPGVLIDRGLTLLGEPVGPLPTGELAERRTLAREVLVERRPPHTARRGLLAEGEVVGIEEAEGLGRALPEVAAVALEGLHPGDVDIAQIERLLAGLHPFRQRHARAARRLDPDRVEPGRDPEVVELGRGAEVVGIIGGEAFGAIEEGVDPGLGQHRQAVHGLLEDRLEMVEILGQLIELKALWDAVHAPGLCLGLKRA